MANEFEKTLKNTAAKIAQYVEDIATAEVVTKLNQVSGDGTADFAQARPGVRTIIRLDGDSETIVPVNAGPDGQLEVNSEIFEIHQSNVQAAIEYRARMMSALLEMLKSYL